MSGVGSMTRLMVGRWRGGAGYGFEGRRGGEAEEEGGAGEAKVVPEVLEVCGEGAVRGERGSGMVVVRGRGEGVGLGLGGVVGFVGIEGVGCAAGVAFTGGMLVLVDTAGVALVDGIDVLVGAAGVGCAGVVFVSTGFGVDATAFFTPSLAAAVLGSTFSVPLALTSSSILLVVGVTGVACFDVAIVLGASFGEAAAFAFTGAFFSNFSFFSLTTLTLSFLTTAAAAAATAAFFTSTGTGSPASSATTFFGRPRFLTAGGSVVGVEDIALGQLAR